MSLLITSINLVSLTLEVPMHKSIYLLFFFGLIKCGTDGLVYRIWLCGMD